eukprot:m.96031 g.96031  ORF g.96031 m.96031 type:complete len:193 (-) comp10138_c1_seq1:151-729(-)
MLKFTGALFGCVLASVHMGDTTVAATVSLSTATFNNLGCFVDILDPQNLRVLPTFFCSNGHDPTVKWATCAPNPDIDPGHADSGYAGYYNMTYEVCNALCAKFTYFGLEEGGECYCGNDQPNQGRGTASECSTPCPGNPAQQCGGSNRINVFSTIGFDSTSKLYSCVDNTCVPSTSHRGVVAATCEAACGHV